MAAGANLGEKLFGMVKTIGPVFQSYAPGLGLLDLAVGVAGAVILYFVVQSKIKRPGNFAGIWNMARPAGGQRQI